MGSKDRLGQAKGLVSKQRSTFKKWSQVKAAEYSVGMFVWLSQPAPLITVVASHVAS